VIFAIVGTGGVNLHGLSDSAPFMAYQQDSKFGILGMHFSDNKLDAKFVTNDGATLDHFSISKTVKKKIIELISDNIVTDTETKAVSDEEKSKTKPLSDKEENDKPAITKELAEDALTDDKAESLHNEDKAVLSDEDKSTGDKSHVGGLLGSSDKIDPVDDETIDHDGERTVTRNDRNPFAGLN
jgi:hypothetical protein